MANTFIYNVLGPGEWQLLDCDAMFPSGGGLVKPQSLLPQIHLKLKAGGEMSEVGGDAERRSVGGRPSADEADPRVRAAAASETVVVVPPGEPSEKRVKSWWRSR